MSRVTSSSSSSKISIQDSSGNPITDTNPLSVSISSSTPGTVISVYQSSSGVAISSSSTVLSYTVPTATTLSLQNIMISSDSVSVFDVQINNILNCRKRIGWTNWNDEFDYNGFELQAGDNIKVIATNNSVQSVAEFNVTLIGTTN